MTSESTNLSEVASQSVMIIAAVIFSQASGFLARIIFKVILTPEQYGLFAFFINMSVFAITLNEFSLHNTFDIVGTIIFDFNFHNY